MINGMEGLACEGERLTEINLYKLAKWQEKQSTDKAWVKRKYKKDYNQRIAQKIELNLIWQIL